jgi:hypothetical protein
VIDNRQTDIFTGGVTEGRRDLRLDAFRGFALWFTFIDHVPNNVLSWLTIRNYGFIDASEVFVFVSGYTCMIAYGGALRKQGWATTVVRGMRRAWEIYAALLLLLIVYFALVWLFGGGIRYLDETNTRPFFQNPGATLAHATILQYVPVNADILPTFILLHLAFPALLVLLTWRAWVALAASFLLYLLVQLFDWRIPTWPNGELPSILWRGRCCSSSGHGTHVRAQSTSVQSSVAYDIGNYAALPCPGCRVGVKLANQIAGSVGARLAGEADLSD